MQIILLVWMLQMVILWAAGLVAQASLKFVLKTDFKLSLPQELILGLCTLSMLFSFLSIGMKISALIFILIALLALVIFVRNFNEIKQRLATLLLHYKAQPSYILVINIFFVIATLFYASGEARVFDTGLYHTQSMRWINEYAVVPGLGNLHSRFAFNSHFFITQAFFDFAFISNPGFVVYAVNSLFFLLTGLMLLKRLFTSPQIMSVIFYFVLLLVACIVILPRIQSPSPDTISFILILNLMLIFYDHNFSFQADKRYIYFFCVILMSYLAVVKLSNLPLLLFAFIAYPMLNFKNIISIAGMVLLFFIPFFIRNYFLSGYLIYPFPTINIFHPDWQIDSQLCIAEINSIKAWAIAPGMDAATVISLSFLAKIKLWFSMLDMFFKVMVVADIFILVLILQKIRKQKFSELLFWSIIFINLLYWFLSAPDPRFSFGLITFTFAFLVASVLKITLQAIQIKTLKQVLLLFIVMVIIAYAFLKLDYVKSVAQNNLLFPQAPKPTNTENAGGINITQDADGRCFNAPLPCACSKNEEIIFRSDKIEDGFKIKK